MKHRLILCDAVAAQPWRNGGGVTRELLAWPGPADWQFRISVAEICRDGAFSAYPGVERWFAVLDGEGVALRIDGSEYRQQPHSAALRFAGEAQVHCQLLGGPTRDLNLMLRHASGTMQKAEHGVAWQAPAGACGLFATQPGRCHIEPASGAGHTVIAVPAFALLWFDVAPHSLRFQAESAQHTDIGYWLAVQTQPGDFAC